MPAGMLYVPGRMPSFSRDGDLVVGYLWFYENQTTTLKTVYADSGLTTPLAQPVVSDQSGNFPPIWADAGTEADPNLFTAVWSTDAPDAQTDTIDSIQPSEFATVIAPTLAIGTVISGTPAAAEITGAAPNYTLNLTLPQGAQGPAGPSGPGTGDLNGPATNTADYVPQWNGANSKLLKNGRAIGAASTTDLLDRQAGDARYLMTATVRERLAADRVYYVRTDGNDANNGLANTSGGAFLTIQRALNVTASAVDFNGWKVTIQAANGTYTGTFVVPVMVGQKTAADLVIQGTGTPASVIFAFSSAGTLMTVTKNAACTLKDVRLNGTNTSGPTAVSVSGTLQFSNVDFAGANTHIALGAGGYAEATGNYSISGAALIHVNADATGVFRCVTRTVTITGSPAFNTFAYVQRLALAQFTGSTFSGSATGIRYAVLLNAVLETTGGGANFLPGNSAGSATTGGQYN